MKVVHFDDRASSNTIMHPFYRFSIFVSQSRYFFLIRPIKPDIQTLLKLLNEFVMSFNTDL